MTFLLGYLLRLSKWTARSKWAMSNKVKRHTQGCSLNHMCIYIRYLIEIYEFINVAKSRKQIHGIYLVIWLINYK